jgi:hypothetical protein
MQSLKMTGVRAVKAPAWACKLQNIGLWRNFKVTDCSHERHEAGWRIFSDILSKARKTGLFCDVDNL